MKLRFYLLVCFFYFSYNLLFLVVTNSVRQLCRFGFDFPKRRHKTLGRGLHELCYEILDLNFLSFPYSSFFLLNLFSVFSLLRSGDIGADTRSKSSLVLTGQFVGRTYQWVCQLLLVTCEETKLLHLSLESIKQLIDVFFLSLLIMIEVKFIPRKVFSSFYLHFILTGTNYQGLALCHSYLQNKIFNRLLARTA